MKTRFWNVQIEMYENGMILAAVLRSRDVATIPRDVYVQNPGREVFSLWFESEAEAQEAAFEAFAMRKEQGVAA
jgi:hypothetical protein